MSYIKSSGPKTSRDFKYIWRDKQDTILLIPGWATDYRIFCNLDLRFNHLLPLIFSPHTLEEKLLGAMEETAVNRISIFGWSLGAFLAADFASKHPQLIDKLILVSARKAYKQKELAEMREAINKNKKACLYKFYMSCFPQRSDMKWLKENLLYDYCNNMELDYLLAGLDYLETAKIEPKALNCIKKIIIVHGEMDNIAPVKEAMEIKDSLPGAKWIVIEGVGHMPFLKEGFESCFDELR